MIPAIEVVFASCALFWLGVLVYYSRRWARDKAKWDDDMRFLNKHMVEQQFARNVSDARLAAIRRAADKALTGNKSPYRGGNGAAHERALREIREESAKGLQESCREVGHFSSLAEAGEFAETRKNSYIVKICMWDGDCYHVLYDAPEACPAGIKVLK